MIFSTLETNPLKSCLQNSKLSRMVLSNRSKYDAFVSYRGEDTCNNFVSPLKHALTLHGITTYIDDVFKKSKPSLKEVEESRFVIVIFSKSYASCSWCLDELLHIMECSKKTGQVVLPVYYYDFSPLNLRRHGPVFGELFAVCQMEKVRAWTSVLVEAANLNGLRLADYRYQATYIKEIVEMVLSKLCINNLYVNQNAMGKKCDTLGDTASSHELFIGMNRQVQLVKELLQETTASKLDAWACWPRLSSWRTDNVFKRFKFIGIFNDFAIELHYALKQHDIYASINDPTLSRIKSIYSECLKASEELSVSVVLLSKEFASSARCLDELVEIMNCNEGVGLRVLPIFYDVDPYDVRCQKGLFGEAFMQNKPEKLEIWRKALVEVGTLAGWYLNGTPKRYEATVIESIVDVILRRLGWKSSRFDNNLIGIEAQWKRVMSLLKLDYGSIGVTGIWGMPGCGKTTLARAVFDQLSTCFDSSCFVENIREVSKYHGLKHIKREMLSRLSKDENRHVRSNYEGVDPIRHRLDQCKILLVLDDVDDSSQLEALLGSGKWFGGGSRIIIVTRDESLLAAHNIKQTYHVKPFDDIESYQFLRRHAFKQGDPTDDYEDLFLEVVSYAGGLPLALEVLSSLLCGKSKKEWTSTLARLQVFPEKAFQNTFKISYDSLDAAEKEIFLHIACLFNNMEKDYVVNILDSFGYLGNTGIRVLEQKSLVRILNGHIKMHNLIQQMGRDIVRQMHPDEPAQRRWLWHAEEVYDTLMDRKNMKQVDAIVVNDMHDYDYDAVDMTNGFRSMKNLTLLHIHSHNKLRFHEGSNYLPESLRWLALENCLLPSLPISFKGDELVGLALRGSSISEPWSGIKFMWKLRFLDLSYSKNLIKTPDFTGTPNLNELNLEYCIRLTEVHESIGSLNMLSLLSFRGCRKLETLPQSVWKLKSLKSLDLSGCLNLKSPSSLMEYQLQVRSASQMIKVPGSITILSNLVELDLSSFKNLSIPSLLSLKFGLKPEGKFVLHDLLVGMGPRIFLSKGKTSSKLVKDEKENVGLLPAKGV